MVTLPTLPLDDAAAKFGLTDASYLKLDIQGAELEVLQSGPRLLAESVMALRVETEFLPIYKGQPLQKDIDGCLRAHGFMPMGSSNCAIGGASPGSASAWLAARCPTRGGRSHTRTSSTSVIRRGWRMTLQPACSSA